MAHPKSNTSTQTSVKTEVSKFGATFEPSIPQKHDYKPQFITGGFTLAGVLLGACLGFALQEWTKKREERGKCKRFLQSIHDEVDATLSLYLAKYGKHLEETDESKGIEGYGMQDQDYFTVYSSNATLLGIVKNKELRKAIVTTYAKAKSLMDSISLNNAILQKREEALKLHFVANANARGDVPALLQDYGKSLVAFAPQLRAAHYDLKKDALELLKMIETELERL
jgi:hypothetical protein